MQNMPPIIAEVTVSSKNKAPNNIALAGIIKVTSEAFVAPADLMS